VHSEAVMKSSSDLLSSADAVFEGVFRLEYHSCGYMAILNRFTLTTMFRHGELNEYQSEIYATIQPCVENKYIIRVTCLTRGSFIPTALQPKSGFRLLF
jgi:hypothetical protein